MLVVHISQSFHTLTHFFAAFSHCSVVAARGIRSQRQQQAQCGGKLFSLSLHDFVVFVAIAVAVALSVLTLTLNI